MYPYGCEVVGVLPEIPHDVVLYYTDLTARSKGRISRPRCHRQRRGGHRHSVPLRRPRRRGGGGGGVDRDDREEDSSSVVDGGGVDDG